MPEEPQENLTTSEAAEYLKLASITLQVWRTNKKGPPYVRAGSRVLYRRVDLQRWMESNTVEPGTEGR